MSLNAKRSVFKKQTLVEDLSACPDSVPHELHDL